MTHGVIECPDQCYVSQILNLTNKIMKMTNFVLFNFVKKKNCTI